MMAGRIVRSVVRDLVIPWARSALWFAVILVPVLLGGRNFDTFGWFFKVVPAWLVGWAIFLILCPKPGVASGNDPESGRSGGAT